ncbi:uncharacterized protein LOC116259615 [Nymphaea colorata]|uniref:uncharacterized protein LOC116259615 n=1 Tax=Nymphaea colorata TaxID=210225 RepID=UPI00129E178A|nr:uncharacterized protein LOC116259615 [Nymphaea colorata]
MPGIGGIEGILGIGGIEGILGIGGMEGMVGIEGIGGMEGRDDGSVGMVGKGKRKKGRRGMAEPPPVVGVPLCSKWRAASATSVLKRHKEANMAKERKTVLAMAVLR